MVTGGAPRGRLRTLLLLRTLLVPGTPELPAPDAWPELLELANDLLVMPALYPVMRRDPPAAVREQIREWQRGNTVRNLRFRRQLIEAVAALNEVGIEPLLFKGSLQLVDGTLAHPGDRLMVDLDLLIPGDLESDATRALTGIGYATDRERPFAQPYELSFSRRRTVGPLDVHTELGADPIPEVLPTSIALAHSTELAVGAGRARALSPTHQVLHNILHAAVQDFNHAVGGLPLRQLVTLAGLVEAHGPAVDWADIRQAMNEHGLGRALRDHLWLAHRFAGMPLPPGDWGWPARLHEARVVASFALVWPAHVQRNLRYAFGSAYLDSLYGHGDRPLELAAARARHAAKLLRQGRRAAFDESIRPRI